MNVVIQNYTRVDVCSYNETNNFMGRINLKYNYFGNGNSSYAFCQ